MAQTTSSSVMPPLDLAKWIDENRHRLKPPVGNQYLYSGEDFFVMVVGGPNARNDFHMTESEEFFLQIKGDVFVSIREGGLEGGKIVHHRIREGETFFIPGNVPHAPQRPPGTIGLVVERRRPPGELEHIIFFCPKCEALVEDIEFDCKDIVEHFSQAMEDFWADADRSTCKKCGERVGKPGPCQGFPPGV